MAKLDGELEDNIISSFNDPISFPWLSQVNFIPAIQQFAVEGALGAPVIAVMDSGVDVDHPALRDNIFVNDEGQNKLCRDDLYGCDTTNPEKDFLGSGSVFSGWDHRL